MNPELIEDFEKHGYDLVESEPGQVVFETTEKKYHKRIDKKTHEEHPIFFNDKSKNFQGNGSKVIIKAICARCNQPIDNGLCVNCGRQLPTPNRKAHIFWKHELNPQ